MENEEKELTQAEIWRNALYTPFELHEYRVREGNKTAWGGIQWFVYVDREAVQTRLDKLFPMAWSLTFGEPIIKEGFVVVTAALSINGCVREFNGGQRAEGRKKLDDDMVKGAYTDAFRRVASMWGIGLELQSAPKIYTDAYPTEPKTDWKAKQACEDAAFAQFAKWWNGEPTPQQKPAEKRATSSASGNHPPQPAQNAKQTPPSAKNGHSTNGAAKHYACKEMTVLQRPDGFQYIAKCGHNLNIVTYSRELYRAALGDVVEAWNKDVPPSGRVIKFGQELQLEAIDKGKDGLELVKVLG